MFFKREDKVKKEVKRIFKFTKEDFFENYDVKNFEELLKELSIEVKWQKKDFLRRVFYDEVKLRGILKKNEKLYLLKIKSYKFFNFISIFPLKEEKSVTYPCFMLKY